MARTLLFGPRHKAEDVIELRAGIRGTVVNASYLAIGTTVMPAGSSKTYVNYGTRSEKAMKRLARGAPLAIVSEEYWAASLEEASE